MLLQCFKVIHTGPGTEKRLTDAFGEVVARFVWSFQSEWAPLQCHRQQLNQNCWGLGALHCTQTVLFWIFCMWESLLTWDSFASRLMTGKNGNRIADDLPILRTYEPRNYLVHRVLDGVCLPRSPFLYRFWMKDLFSHAALVHYSSPMLRMKWTPPSWGVSTLFCSLNTVFSTNRSKPQDYSSLYQIEAVTYTWFFN